MPVRFTINVVIEILPQVCIKPALLPLTVCFGTANGGPILAMIGKSGREFNLQMVHLMGDDIL